MASDRNAPAPRRPGAPGAATPRDALAVAGFTCLLATMVLYSAAAMPFQRFETLPSFTDAFGYALRTAAVLGLGTAVLAAAAPRAAGALGSRGAMAAGGALYLAGNAWFCLMALGAAGPGGARAAGVLIGAGGVAQCLAWGRVLAAYDLRRAVAVVAASAVLAALLGWVQLALPEAGAVALFMACSLACAALPFALGAAVRRESGDGSAEAGADGSPAAADAASPGRPRRSVRTFLDVALVPSVGLILFAVLMGMRGELFFEDYPQYVAVQVIVAALLFVAVLLPVRRPLLQGIYRGLVPVLAVAVLTANYLSEAVLGGSSLEIALVMVLYTAAALLALSTLAGIAHAGEFPADLVSALTVGVFALVTAVVQVVGARIDPDPALTRDVIVVTSGLYAAGMVVFTIVRGLSSGAEEAAPVSAAGAAGMPDARGISAAAGRSRRAGGTALDALGPTLDERCDALAARYGLTAREREILGHLALGHSGSYIGDELLISPNTARTHIHNIYRKCGVSTRDEVQRLVWG